MPASIGLYTFAERRLVPDRARRVTMPASNSNIMNTSDTSDSDQMPKRDVGRNVPGNGLAIRRAADLRRSRMA
jgi:hypothetical protein